MRWESEKTKHAVRVMVAAAILLLCITAADAAPPGSVFTYQGVLNDGGGPAEGPYDLQFRLFDAASGGAELGLVVIDDLEIRDGRLTADLDFGDPFDGRSLWLEIEVRDGASTGAHTTLTPRQPLTAAPYTRFAADAGHASTADNASTAGDADTLDGQHGAFYLAWSNRTGVPSGLDDGDDDVLGGLVCAPDEVAKWSGGAWDCDTDDGLELARTVIVRATTDSLANGAALLAAVDAVPTPSSQEQALEVRLEPGVYDLGDQRLDTEPWMLLRGAGQGVTLIRSAYCSTGGISVGVVTGNDHVEIRDLTVENSCVSPSDRKAAVTFGSSYEFGRLTRVTARSVGGAERCIGIKLDSDDSVMERVTAIAADCPSVNTGIQVQGERSLLLDCVASATGGTYHDGLLLLDGSSRVIRGSFEADGTPGGNDAAITVESDAEIVDVSARGEEYSVRVSAFEDLIVTMSRVQARGKVATYVDSGRSLAFADRALAH